MIHVKPEQRELVVISIQRARFYIGLFILEVIVTILYIFELRIFYTLYLRFPLHTL